jgi:ADP-glucose pyrophosphorylase
MTKLSNSKYLRYRYEEYIKDNKELLDILRKKLKKEENPDKIKTLKKHIKETEEEVNKTYEEFVDNYLLLHDDVAIAICRFNDYSLVIPKIMLTAGCTHRDAKKYHYYNYVKVLKDWYNLNMEFLEKYGDIYVNSVMANIIDDSGVFYLEGRKINEIFGERFLLASDTMNKIKNYLKKKGIKDVSSDLES